MKIFVKKKNQFSGINNIEQIENDVKMHQINGNNQYEFNSNI